jgi:hypothetical protein
MISLRRTFLSKLVLLILVFILCIFYIRNLNNFNTISSSNNSNSNNNNNNVADKTKISNNVPQPQRLQSELLLNQIQEPDSLENLLVNEEKNSNVLNANEEKEEGGEEENSISSSTKINKYELEIQRDFLKQQEDPNLGANGKIAHLTDPEDIAEGEKQLTKIALNEELSNHISFNRTTPDARNPACKNKIYDLNSLPTTSVIIIFFNEPYSVLVRTVHSVLNTSPPNLLREIILVDDGSSNVELKGKLDYYVRTRFSDKVKVLRLKNR